VIAAGSLAGLTEAKGRLSYEVITVAGGDDFTPTQPVTSLFVRVEHMASATTATIQIDQHLRSEYSAVEHSFSGYRSTYSSASPALMLGRNKLCRR
jgi:hypothetical protein